MNKKGFTLIELLATILILLIVIIVSTPSILSMMDKAGSMTKGTIVERLVDAAKEYVTSYNRSTLNGLINVGDKKQILSDTLVNAGLIEKSEIELLEQNTVFVQVTLQSDNQLKYDVEYDSSLITNGKPYITILGDSTYYVELDPQNHPFVEPGFVAFDNQGNNITNKVKISGNTVNTSVSGTYTIYYDVADSAGVAATQVSRTVVVRDSVVPSVTVATISSNNSVNTKKAKNGDTITLNITFSKSISNTPTVTIGGRTASVSGSGTTRIATYTIPSNESTLTEGDLAISISNYKDIYSNVGATKTSVTSGGNVNYDRTLPAATSATIVSNNALSNKQAKNGDTLTLSLVFSEMISNAPTITFEGRTATAVTGGGMARTATYLIPSAEATLTEGNIDISISNYNDMAGNTGSTSTTITSGGTVNYDRTPPAFTYFYLGGTGNPTYITDPNSILYFLVSGATQMCVSATTNCTDSIDTGDWVTYAASKTYTLSGDGTKTLYTWFRDQAGNTIGYYSDAVILDTADPTVTVATIVSDNANNKQATNGDTVTLNMTFSESLGTAPTVAIGGRTASVSGSGTTRIATYTIPSDEATLTQGALSISISGYKDLAGNTGATVTSVTSGGTVNYDRTPPTPPTFAASPATWTNGNVTVTGTYSGDSATKKYMIGSDNLTTNWKGTTITGTGYNPGWDSTLNTNAITVSGWSTGYNSGVTSPDVGYHALWTKGGIDGASDPVMKFVDRNDTYGLGHRWEGIAQTLPLATTSTWAVGNQIVITWYQKSDVTGKGASVGLYHYATSLGANSFETCQQTVNVSSTNTWEQDSVTCTITSNWDLTKSISVYLYGHYGNYGTLYADNVSVSKIENTWATYSSALTLTANKVVYGQGIDAAGNASDYGRSVVDYIDKVTPPGDIVINSDATYTTSTGVTLTLSSNDVDSGTTQMCISNTSSCSTWETYATSKAWTLTTGDGTKTVYAWFKDAAGNQSAAYTDTIILDTTDPTGSVTIGATYTNVTGVTLTLTYSADTTLMCISNTSSCSAWVAAATSKAWTVTTGDGTKTVYAWFKDAAGNQSVAYTDTTILDTTVPTGSVTIGETYTPDTAVTLTLTYSADTTQMCVSNTSSCSAWVAAATSKAWTVTTGDGTKTVYVWFKDAAGNQSGYYTDTTILDTTDPVFTYVYIGGTGNPHYITSLSTTIYSSVSGATQMCFSETASCSSWVTYAASYAKALGSSSYRTTKTIYAWYRDAAGNTIGYYTDQVRYLQSSVALSFDALVSGYSYSGTNSWVVSTSTVIQGSSANTGYYGVMFFGALGNSADPFWSTRDNAVTNTIDSKPDYTISNFVVKIQSHVAYARTVRLNVGGPCPTPNYSTLGISGDGTTGNPYKPVSLGGGYADLSVASNALGTWTITSTTLFGYIKSASAECLFIYNPTTPNSDYYWEGDGAKTTTGPSFTINLVPTP